MHDEILTKTQHGLLALVKKFSPRFCLVGGTACALHLGHRRSIDFDLFTFNPFDNDSIRKIITKTKRIDRVVFDERGQYTLVIDGVRFTFFQYPFPITFPCKFGNVIKMPNLITLAAMKAYALGRRAKWKDYVDLYFIIKLKGLSSIITRAKKIFGKEFNEKLFRAQLTYFEDVDYSEGVIYMPGLRCTDSLIRKTLTKMSLKK